MPSSVLNGDIPYAILFPSKSLFPIEPHVFGSTCFVRDVCPQVTKLDPKSSVSFLDTLGIKNDIGVFLRISIVILCLLMLPFLILLHSFHLHLCLRDRGG